MTKLKYCCVCDKKINKGYASYDKKNYCFNDDCLDVWSSIERKNYNE